MNVEYDAGEPEEVKKKELERKLKKQQRENDLHNFLHSNVKLAIQPFLKAIRSV